MKKGFTLVELIIVVTIIMLLGTIAVGMYFNSTKNLNFFTSFKAVQSTFRQARSFAITNASLQNVTPDRFGIFFEEDKTRGFHLFMFADNGEKPYEFEPKDTVYLTKDFYFSKDDFSIALADGSKSELTLPVAFYYEKNTGDFSVFQTQAVSYPNATKPIPKSAKNYIDIFIKDLAKDTLYRHLIINQVSGLSEEYLNL